MKQLTSVDLPRRIGVLEVIISHVTKKLLKKHKKIKLFSSVNSNCIPKAICLGKRSKMKETFFSVLLA